MARPKNCKRCKKPKEKDCICGRPTKMTEDVLKKLREAFSVTATDEEACAYAEITTTTLYNYQTANPEFLEEKNRLKLKPNITSRQTIIGSLGSIGTAQWWATKKMPKEFGEKATVDVNVKPLSERVREQLKKIKNK